MLRKLSIRNYALIRELELSFGSGLNIITGETGAGKSIMIGALGLILGNRADVNVLYDSEQKCYVEAIFDMDKKLLKSFFEENEIDIEEVVILRRQINPQGKSRAFINDTPVKLPILRELSGYLIDVNTQHQTFSLNNTTTQLHLLDDYASLSDKITKYRIDYFEYKSLLNQLNILEEKERKVKAEQDYLQFQFDELENANLVEGEYETIESELKIVGHAEEILSKLFEAEQALSADEDGGIEKIVSATNAIQSIAQYHVNYKDLHERLTSALLELQDIAQEIEISKDSIDFNPAKMEELSNRIDLLNHLQQKHLLNNPDDLLDLKNTIEEKLLSIDTIVLNKGSLQKEISDLFDKLIYQADEIHKIREQVISDVQIKVEKNLIKLGMKGAHFIIDLKKEEDINEWGRSKIQFLFSANTGIEVAPISKVASGGELSRLMLTLKYVLTSNKSLSTIIFDEIDTGVSGDIAGKVGDMMKSMGKKMQIISITHLPQIAGKAKSHYKVFKQEENNKTFSSIRLLNENERIEELSLMLSGKKDSQAALATARELME
jgi:DNA repair protein RecN (Recombination protein N)